MQLKSTISRFICLVPLRCACFPYMVEFPSCSYVEKVLSLVAQCVAWRAPIAYAAMRMVAGSRPILFIA